MAVNPWQDKILNDFIFICCPECSFKCKHSNSFENHALGNHPQSQAFFKQCLDPIDVDNEFNMDDPEEPDKIESETFLNEINSLNKLTDFITDDPEEPDKIDNDIIFDEINNLEQFSNEVGQESSKQFKEDLLEKVEDNIDEFITDDPEDNDKTDDEIDNLEQLPNESPNTSKKTKDNIDKTITDDPKEPNKTDNEKFLDEINNLEPQKVVKESSKKFKDNLTKKIEGKPNICPICMQDFGNQFHRLAAHMESHLKESALEGLLVDTTNGKKIYACSKCRQECQEDSGYIRHYQQGISKF